MEEVEYWVFKSTLCSHLHKGDRVNRGGPLLNVPFDGERECQNQPGKSAQCQTRDWRTITDTQWQEIEDKVG